jgi:hypothetical protein
VKSKSDAKGHEKAREEFELTKLPAEPNLRAIRAADEACKAEVARWGRSMACRFVEQSHHCSDPPGL